MRRFKDETPGWTRGPVKQRFFWVLCDLGSGPAGDMSVCMMYMYIIYSYMTHAQRQRERERERGERCYYIYIYLFIYVCSMFSFFWIICLYIDMHRQGHKPNVKRSSWRRRGGQQLKSVKEGAWGLRGRLGSNHVSHGRVSLIFQVRICSDLVALYIYIYIYDLHVNR